MTVKKYPFKLLLLVLAGGLCFFALQKAYWYGNDHFNLGQIRSAQEFPPFPAPSLSPIELENIRFILSQPFFYLGKGSQSYVFESQDHKYVIKFFKQKHFKKKHSWLLYLPIFSFLKSEYEEKNHIRQERLRTIFESTLLAYQELSQETGMLYLHLNKKSDPLNSVMLVDKLGFPHHIDANVFEFVLQKKGSPLNHYFHEIKNHPEKVSKILEKVVNAIHARCQKNILDLDEDVILNMAVTQDFEEVFFIDVGFFTKSLQPLQPDEIQKELARRFTTLRLWAEKSCPELIPYLIFP